MTTGGFSLTADSKNFSNNVWKPTLLEDSVGTPENGQSLFGRKHAGFSFGGGSSLQSSLIGLKVIQ